MVQFSTLHATVAGAVVVGPAQVLVADGLLAVQVSMTALAAVAIVDDALLPVSEHQATSCALPLGRRSSRSIRWARYTAAPRRVVSRSAHVRRAAHLGALHLAQCAVAALAVVGRPGCPISVHLPVSSADRGGLGRRSCRADGAAMVLQKQWLQTCERWAGFSEAALLAGTAQAAQARLRTP